jgi:energy-coupling factor transporter ATP-binding protein EcfA2
MDEPLSNLDAKLRVQMRADIARLQHDLGTTTIYVTHDQIEAVTMGHRVAVMSQGLLQQVDTPMRLFDVPANLFVAAFIGTPPMNLLEGDVHASNGKVALQVGGQRLELADKTLARYPQVKAYDGRKAVMGVRPDDLHAAATRPDLPVMTARLDLLEALGTHSVAYFKVEAEAFTGTAIVEEEEQETTGEGVTGSRPNLVASVPSREALELKIGDQVPLGSTSGPRTCSTRRRVRRCASALGAGVALAAALGRLAAGAAALASTGAAPALRRCAARALATADVRAARVRADLLRPPRPVRERRPLERPRRPRRRPRGHRLRPRRSRLVPRRRSQGPHRRLHRPAARARARPRPRLQRDLDDAGAEAEERAGRQRRLPRLLGPRLHDRRPTPR